MWLCNKKTSLLGQECVQQNSLRTASIMGLCKTTSLSGQQYVLQNSLRTVSIMGLCKKTSLLGQQYVQQTHSEQEVIWGYVFS